MSSPPRAAIEAGGRERVVLITSSYPRFPGDNVGTFMEPIAHAVAALGHEVHVVLPWHPCLARPAREGDVHFHPFRYAPFAALNVFGYAGAMKADVSLRFAAFAAAPLALVGAGRMARRVARQIDATVVHAHWVIPFGAVGAAIAGTRPLVVSLHGSDVYVSERSAAIRLAARRAFRRADWLTACSDDLRRRAVALGAPAERSETVPYGVNVDRFRPDGGVRAQRRQMLGAAPQQPIIFTAGRLVRKKGFEYLIDAMPEIVRGRPDVLLVIGGGGDLDAELRARASASGVGAHVRFVGVLKQEEVADMLAAADVAVVPSVHDDAGNVDGLPNVVMESLASGTPLVATTAGGIATVATDGETALLVGERDPRALAAAIGALIDDGSLRTRLGSAARQHVAEHYTWTAVARRFERSYQQARRAAAATGRR